MYESPKCSKGSNKQMNRHTLKPLHPHGQFSSGTPTDFYRLMRTTHSLHKFCWLPTFLSLYLR